MKLRRIAPVALLLAVTASACRDGRADDDRAGTAAPVTTAVATTTATAPATVAPSSSPAPTTTEGLSGELSLVVGEYSGRSRRWWSRMVAAFERAHPDVSVALDVVSWEEINDVLADRVESGDAPDIANIDVFGPYADRGLLRPAADVLGAERRDDIFPNFAEHASVDGVQYAIPLTGSSRALLYNTELFAAAGLSAPPRTWDELRAAARAITDLPGDEVGYAMPLGPEEAEAEASIWMIGNGGGWLDDQGAFAIDSAANVDAFQYMGDLAAEGVTEADPATTDRTDAFNNFLEGRVGMIEGQRAQAEFIAQSYLDLEVAVAPSPTRSGDPATLAAADHLIVFANEGNTEAAGAFLDAFSTTDTYVSFLTAERLLPVTRSASEAMAGELSPELRPFLDALATAGFYPINDPAWPAVLRAAQFQLGAAIGGDPAAVLGDLQAIAEG